MPEVSQIPEEHELTWADIQTFLRRYWTVILITFCAVVIGAYVTLSFMTDQYESKASVLVKLGRENIELPTVVQNTGIVTTGMRPEELNSEIQLLKSRAVVEEVVNRIGVTAFAFNPPPPKTLLQRVKFYAKKTMRWGKARYTDLLIALNLQVRLSDRENVILLLEKAIEAVPEKTSDVLSVTVRLPSAPLAVQVESNLLDVYMSRRADLHHNAAERNFLWAEVARKQQQVQALTDQRDQVRARYGVSSVPEQRAMLLKQIADLQTELVNDRGTDATLRSQQTLMRQRLPTLSGSVPSTEVQTLNPAVQSYKERLTELQTERAKLTSRYLETAEPVLKLDDEIRALEAQLRNEPRNLTGSTTTESNPVRRSFEQNTQQNDVVLAGLDAHISEVAQPLSAAQARLHNLDIGEEKLETIDREVKIAQDAYLDLARRAEQARFGDQLEQSHIANVSLLAAPSEPIEPVYPRKLLIMALAFPVGLVLGLVLAFLLYAMDDTVYTEEDLRTGPMVQFLGTYTAGSLPETA